MWRAGDDNDHDNVGDNDDDDAAAAAAADGEDDDDNDGSGSGGAPALPGVATRSSDAAKARLHTRMIPARSKTTRGSGKSRNTSGSFKPDGKMSYQQWQQDRDTQTDTQTD